MVDYTVSQNDVVRCPRPPVTCTFLPLTTLRTGRVFNDYHWFASILRAMHAPIPPTGPHICIHVHMYRYSLYTHIGLYKLDSSSTIRDVPAASRISYSSFAQILEHGAIHNNHTVLSKSNPGLHGHARLRDRLGLVLASPREGTQTK